MLDGKCAHGGGQIAAVAAPIDKRFIDGNLSEQIIDIVIVAFGFVQNHGFAGGRTGVTQTVNLFTVRVGAAEYAQEDFVACPACFLRSGRQIGTFEENAFRCTAAVVNSWNFNLRHFEFSFVFLVWFFQTASQTFEAV
ncbi:Uncharacterised protein [Mycobacteroides abscessus subsp. massiliense]|nr:Uncharacterised protein [Mycobacteroides abscessus subsp. massiliense]